MFRRYIKRHNFFFSIFLAACGSHPRAEITPILRAPAPSRQPVALAQRGAAEGIFISGADRLVYQMNGQVFSAELSTDSWNTEKLFSETGSIGNLQLDASSQKLYYTISPKELPFPSELSPKDTADIYTYELKTGKKMRFSKRAGYNGEAFASKDGRWVLFTSGRDGDLELYMAMSDGSKLARLTHRVGYDGSPSFSPDMKYVLWRGFRTQRKDLSDLYLARLVFKNEVPHLENVKVLTARDNALYLTPSWYPDSAHILFASNRSARDKLDIYLANTEFNCIQRISDSSGTDLFPTTSTDGRFLTWTSARNGEASQILLAPFSVDKASCSGSTKE